MYESSIGGISVSSRLRAGNVTVGLKCAVLFAAIACCPSSHAAALTITTTSLPTGFVGTAYSASH